MSKIFQTCRQGFSLLEVLVSVFVVLVGLLGVATMIPAGRYEMLQARKADMGADLSRAVMNSVITQISNGWNPNGGNYYFVAGDVAEKLKDGLDALGLSNGQPIIDEDKKSLVNNDRMFNGDDDVAFTEGDNNKIQVFPNNNNELLGTGYYTACATVVSLGGGYYEVTGLAVYRYSSLEEGSDEGPKLKDATDYKRGSYAFFSDDSGINRWYKIENVSTTGIDTVVGQTNEFKYLGDVIGISRKVVRIDSYTDN